MTAPRPAITVIMATWGRGRHILPSIRSVLAQSFADFELLVIGDACVDETGALVQGIGDDRVRWVNLADRVGSQSGPNTAGIKAARGEIIAYLGHDDVWHPSHLATVADGFDSPDCPDFVVSGVICHLPNGLAGAHVHGLFPDGSANEAMVFPPSAFAHRRAVIDRIGGWNLPGGLRSAVDVDFLGRAFRAGLLFCSTGRVTVHKFSAAERYLCYVQPDALEQEAMLADFAAADHTGRMAEIVADAREQGTYMTQVSRVYDHLSAGELLRRSLRRRGIDRRQLEPLGRKATIRQETDLCGLDWKGWVILGIRLHDRNPKPKVLLPYSADGPVRLTIRVVHPDRAALGALQLRCNGDAVAATPVGVRRSVWGWTARFRAEIRLLPDRPSLLEFELTDDQLRKRPYAGQAIGFGIGRLQVQPV